MGELQTHPSKQKVTIEIFEKYRKFK